jgi:nitrogen fixation NifU-like protein
MSDLRELYRDMVMEHNRKPRNFRKMEEPTCSLEGYNPLCGDRVTVYVQLKDDTIDDIAFQGSGCAISRASASMMTEAVKGKSTAEAEEIFEAVRTMFTKGNSDADEEKLGDLVILSGVSEFPTRIKCATLAWHALHTALQGRQQTVSTE